MNNTIKLAHGGGGLKSRELIEEEIASRFGGGEMPDAASIDIQSNSLRFSTDSFVVQPFKFPGGNIGDLAVFGTVNDLAVAGGRPLWLSLGLILEEGFPFQDFRDVLDSIKRAADSCGVRIVTGDTKVVGKGSCDGIFINTAGIGEALPGFDLSLRRIVPGDAVIVSGPLASHGFAVMAARESLALKNAPLSDTASVFPLVQSLLPVAPQIKIMRDPTRGGLAAVLNEFAHGLPFGLEIDEARIPLEDSVLALAEMLGIDPLHAPSEGRVIAICAPEAVDAVTESWAKLPEGRGAAVVGRATERAGKVVLCTTAGGRRILDMPAGELLPRIC